jgi:hypothetical protein
MDDQSNMTATEMVANQKQDDTVKSEAAAQVAKEALMQEIRLDTGTTPDPADVDDTANRWQGSDEIQMFAHFVDVNASLDTLKKAIDEKDGIPENKIAGLLILERNGQNRTEFVKAMVKRLGIKDLKKELPQAGGPDYTNDQTALSAL